MPANEYLVFLSPIHDETMMFYCRALSRDHAQEQAMDAYPNHDVCRVCRVIDLDE